MYVASNSLRAIQTEEDRKEIQERLTSESLDLSLKLKASLEKLVGLLA